MMPTTQIIDHLELALRGLEGKHRGPTEQLAFEHTRLAYNTMRSLEGDYVAESELEEQGDTGGYGGATQAPTREVPIYNIWDDTLDIDEWVYTAEEALVVYQTGIADNAKGLKVAKYREVDGNVMTQEDAQELSYLELAELAREEARPQP